MVPIPIVARNHSSRLLYVLLSLASQYAPRILHRTYGGPDDGPLTNTLVLTKRDSEFDPHQPKYVVFAVLIPVLVLMSGLFAGLTLGYMSLDETQLNVLSISGTPEQRKYALKIMPIRKNGHLLLVTLLLANMIVNESLPVIADPVLGGGVQSVVVSTVLIVIFAEIIPQSLFTRHGLYLGAKMAGFTKVLIYIMGVIAWPVAKLLEFVLGPHHGIIYRRAELKELIAMHSSHATHGGDLKTDTVTIIGATLDLQEKVVRQAMTPISEVFMLSIDSKLDYALLKKICQTGHSRVPVYEEVDVPVSVVAAEGDGIPDEKPKQRTQKVKKIVGIFLVKHCVLLDPKDATPLRKIPLNKVPFVPNNEPLLGILDKFQEGRSHMAIVSRFSVDKAASVKQAVKRGLTQRLRKRVGMGDTDSDSDSNEDDKHFEAQHKKRGRRGLINRKKDVDEGTSTTTESPSKDDGVNIFESQYDVERGLSFGGDEKGVGVKEEPTKRKDEGGMKSKIATLQLPKVPAGMTSMSMLEQSMPADAVLAKEGAAEFLQGFDPAVMPLGIITLEDVLEELIGEEIYDEFDPQGAHGDPYEVPPFQVHDGATVTTTVAVTQTPSRSASASRPPSAGGAAQPKALTPQGFFRTRSAPPVQRDDVTPDGGEDMNRKALRAGGGAKTNVNAKTVRLHEPEETSENDVDRDKDAPLLQMPRPIRSAGRHPPSVILEQHSSISSEGSGTLIISASNSKASEAANTDVAPHTKEPPGFLSVPTAALTLAVDGKSKTRPGLPGAAVQSVSVPSSPSPMAIPPHVVAVATAPLGTGTTNSRSASPNLPLEAILLDRKRRMAAAQGQGPVTPGAPSPAQQSAQTDPSTLALSPTNHGTSANAASNTGPNTTSGVNAGSGATGATTGGVVSSGGMTSTIPIPPNLVSSRAAHGPSNKGTRFKSSPLGGGERAPGVVVAESVGAAYGTKAGAEQAKEESDQNQG